MPISLIQYAWMLYMEDPRRVQMGKVPTRHCLYPSYLPPLCHTPLNEAHLRQRCRNDWQNHQAGVFTRQV